MKRKRNLTSNMKLRFSYCSILYGLLFIGAFNASDAQQNTVSAGSGFVAGQSTKLTVVPGCGNDVMSIRLQFNVTQITSFTGWIVVGSTNRPECRLKGNGETEYVIEIPLNNDPCGTVMPTPTTLENVIRISQNPALILQGDETVTVRCVYGLPRVGTNPVPIVDPFVKPPLTFVTPAGSRSQGAEDGETGTSRDGGKVKRAGNRLRNETILLLMFLILFIALAFLLFACLYFFFKRRKVRLERRRRLLVNVPQGSEIGKLGIGHLWWTGKHSNLTNDAALLNHDYMIGGSSSAREGLSVSTDYGNSTPSTGSGGSPHHAGGGGGGAAGGHGSPTAVDHPSSSRGVYANDIADVYVHSANQHGMMPPPPQRMLAGAPISSLQAIPEEGRPQQIQFDKDGRPTAQLYTRVQKGQAPQPPHASSISLDNVEMTNPHMPGGTSRAVSQLRSITELYAGAESPPQHDDDEERRRRAHGDTDSVSTLEGMNSYDEYYCLPLPQQHRQTTPSLSDNEQKTVL